MSGPSSSPMTRRVAGAAQLGSVPIAIILAMAIHRGATPYTHYAMLSGAILNLKPACSGGRKCSAGMIIGGLISGG